jgi:MFS family permease
LSTVRNFIQDIRDWLRNADPFYFHGAPRRYRKGMKMFLLFGVFISASFAFVGAYITLYALALDATEFQVGLISSASSLLGMLAPIPGAQLSARWGKRKIVVLISFLLRRAALFCALLVPFFFEGQAAVYSVIAFMALRVGFGSLGNPAWTSLAGDIIPMDRRGRFFGARKTIMAFVSMGAVPAAGQIVEWVGEPQGYQVVFGISILFGLIGTWFYAQIPEPPPSKQQAKQTDPAAFLRAFQGNRTFLLYTLITMVFSFSRQLGGPYFGVYQVEILHASPSVVGLLSTASALSRMVGQYVWGNLVDHRGARWVRSVCTLLIPFLPFIWLPMTKPWHILFVSMPAGFLWAGYQTSNFSLMMELPDAAHRTQAVAGFSTLVGIANMIAPLIGGRIVATLGYKWDFALSGIGRMVGGILFVLLLKPFGGREVDGRQ